jgi:hypothetical protein
MKNKTSKISTLLLTLSLVACASQKLQKEWDTRGYTESDKALIMPYFNQYNSQLAAAKTNTTNPFMAASDNGQVEASLRTTFCNCVKKIGDACRKPGATVSKADLQLWAKSNAAEMALKAQHNLNIVAAAGGLGSVDPDQCAN